VVKTAEFLRVPYSAAALDNFCTSFSLSPSFLVSENIASGELVHLGSLEYVSTRVDA